MAYNVNTTGKHAPEEYNVGKGELFIAPIADDLSVGGFVLAGSVSEMTVSLDVEKVQHTSTYERYSNTDREIVISTDANLSFSVDNYNTSNLSKFLLGDEATVTNPSQAGFTGGTLVADGGITLASEYPIVNSSGARAYNMRAADVTVKTTNATPVTLALTTDYTVDEALGMVFLVPTSTALATAITNGEGLTVDVTANANSLASVTTVSALQNVDSNFRVMFKALDVGTGRKTEILFSSVSLTPDGDMVLISDDFSSLPFTGIATSKSGEATTDPAIKITIVDADTPAAP